MNFNWDTIKGNWNQFKGAIQERWGEMTDDNVDEARGNWNQFKGSIQERWGELNDDDIIAINGDREQLINTVQSKYNIAREKAEQQVEEWESQFNQTPS